MPSPSLATTSPFQRAIVVILALTTSILVLTLLVKGLDPWLSSLATDRLVLLSAVPVLLLFSLLLGVFGRLLPALLLTALLVVTLFYINEVKLYELQQPLTSTDFLLWQQAILGSDLLFRYGNTPALLTVFVLTGLLVALTWPFEPIRLPGRGRLIIAAASSVLLLALLSPPVHRIYEREGALETPWHPLASVRNSGLMVSLVVALKSDFFDLPEPQPERAARLRERLDELVPEAPAAAATTPGDVIVILSESFFDPGILEGVETCDVIPRWCELTARGISGQLRVPTFGGNTTRTEFEVLTGIPYRILPEGIYPYQSVVTRPMLSLPRVFRQQGYRTLAIHPHLGSFWQRDRAMPLLGFDDFISERDMPDHQRSGFYISDRSMTDQMLLALNDSDREPLFLFAISVENHGPWSSYRPNMDRDRLAALPGIDGVSPAAQGEWRMWLYHARNTVAQLERLLIELEGRDRPAHVLFFGDHLPALNRLYSEQGFDNGKQPFAQTTPYLLVSNQAETSWMPRHAHQLADWTLSALQIESPRSYRDLANAHALLEAAQPGPGIAIDLEPIYLELLHGEPD
jgi:phosphoglycerol transferase MdoB-like AlkP superfamily enzyme